jgi:hypothetical protein
VLQAAQPCMGRGQSVGAASGSCARVLTWLKYLPVAGALLCRAR